jgi:hypothetical protein
MFTMKKNDLIVFEFPPTYVIPPNVGTCGASYGTPISFGRFIMITLNFPVYPGSISICISNMINPFG